MRSSLSVAYLRPVSVCRGVRQRQVEYLFRDCFEDFGREAERGPVVYRGAGRSESRVKGGEERS